MTETNPRQPTLDAISAAESASPEESAAGAVYAQVAIAQALLACHEALVGIRNELFQSRTMPQ